MLLGIAVCGCAPIQCRAEDGLPDAPQAQPKAGGEVTLRALPMNIIKDQGVIWTSPLRIRVRDLKYLVPLGVATGFDIKHIKTY